VTIFATTVAANDATIQTRAPRLVSMMTDMAIDAEIPEALPLIVFIAHEFTWKQE